MVNSIKGDWMSQKRNMSKQQRIYLEHKNKEKIKKELEELAESQWEGCHGCDENDKYFWTGGFIAGHDYQDSVDVQKAVNSFFDDKFIIDGSCWIHQKQKS